MAENTEFFCQSIAAYLQAKLGIQTDYVSSIPWQERERLFDEGKIHILGFVDCLMLTRPICATAEQVTL